MTKKEKMVLESYNICPDEARLVVESEFGNMEGDNRGRIRVHLNDANKGSALELELGKKNQILMLKKGPTGTDELLDAVNEKLRADLARAEYMVVNFLMLIKGDYGITGYYRKDDDFQIVPVPSEAPQLNPGNNDFINTNYICGDHPCKLQFKIFNSPNAEIRELRRIQRAQELSLILNLFLTANVRIDNGYDHVKSWAFSPGKPAEYLKIGYNFEGFCREQTDFDSIATMAPLRQFAPERYYNLRHDVRAGDVPENLNDIINRYNLLEQKKKDRILRAGYWMRLSDFVRHESRSASYTSMISAIEALMGAGPTGVVTKSVCKFIEQFGGVEFPDAERYYDTRSGISHGRKLLEHDIKPSSVVRGWVMNRHFTGQESDILRMPLMVKKAALIWLMQQETDNGDETWTEDIDKG